MYICVCGAVRERQLRKIAEETDLSWKDACHSLNLAQSCGICAVDAKHLFDQVRSERQKSSAGLPVS